MTTPTPSPTADAWVSPVFLSTCSHSLSYALQLCPRNPMYLGQNTLFLLPTVVLTSPSNSRSLLLPLPQPGILFSPVQAPHSSPPAI